MRRRALSIAVLLGLASLAETAEVRATPTLGASITIEQGNVVQVGGKRAHGQQNFQGGKSMHHGKGFAWGHKGFYDRPKFHHDKGFVRHHQGYHRPGARYRHPDTFIARQIGRNSFVIVGPIYGRPSYRSYVAPRPLIKNGSFARRQYW